MTDMYGRPSAPIEEREYIFIQEVLLKSSHGIFIPQFFTQQVKKLECVPDWAWNNCNKGPDAFEDSYEYWDSWTEILEKFEYVGESGSGATCRYFLDYEDGDLCLMREIIEPAERNDYEQDYF